MTTNIDKTDIVISISNLNVTRGKIEVLTNFDLEINKGSVTGLRAFRLWKNNTHEVDCWIADY